MYTVIDIETTGLSKNYHHITEIAAVKIRDRKIIDSYHTLVNPHVRIPEFISTLTGIDNELVKDAPSITEVLPLFHRFLGDDIFVAHNATFDYGFLEHNLRRHDYRLSNQRLCTRKLARRLFPSLPQKRLQDICRHLNIQNDQAHRAMGDALATSAVFIAMLDLLQEKGISEIKEILKFEKSIVRK